MPTQLDIRQSVLRSALNMAGSAANASVDSILIASDALIAKLYEDRNVVLTDGGQISYNVAGTSVTFSEALKLIVNSRVAGGSPVVIDLGSTTRAFSADGRMLYAVIDRVAGTATVTADSATLPAISNANQEVYLIAKRRDTAGGSKKIYFRNGVILWNGQDSLNLLPAADNTYDIGSTSLRWRDLYLSDKLAIGLTVTPTFNIDVQNDASAPNLRLRSTVAQIPSVQFDSNRTANGQNLSTVRSFWNGTEVARIAVFSGGSFAGAKDDAQLSFQTRATGGALTEHLLIDTFGNITASTNVSDNVTWIGYNITSQYNSTTTESTSSRALRVQLLPNVSTGVTQSSSSVASDIISTRSLGTDLGSLGSINGLRIAVGHVTGAGATATTGSVTGIQITPNIQVGTISGDMYGIFIATAPTGGTLSGGLYGIYQQDATAVNFFNGFLNIGNLNPSSVAGIYVDSKTFGLGAVFNSTHASGTALKFNNSGVAFGYLGSGAQIAAGGFYTPVLSDFGINASVSGKLVLCSNDVVRAVIDTPGNMGIGTLPATGIKLHLMNTSGSTFLRIDGSSGDNSAVIQMWGSSTVTSNWRITNNATISGAFEISRQLTSTPTYAPNAFAIGPLDNVGIGEAPNAAHALIVAGPNLTGTSQHGVRSDLTANTNATAQVNAFYASPATSATTGTLANIFGYHAANGGSAGRTITTQFGFYADQLSVGGTNNYAFFSNQTTSQNGSYHFFGQGNAPSYFGGFVGIGISSPTKRLYVKDNSSASTTVGNSEVVRIAGGSSVTNTLSEIGLTYGDSATDTYSGAIIGYRLASGTGFGKGSIYFATRDVTTDTAPLERMRVDEGGRVLVARTSDSGLGILQTDGNLDVSNSVAGAIIRVRSIANQQASVYMQNTTSGTTATDGFSLFLNTDNISSYVWNYENGPMLFGTNNAERMRILSTGEVGINVTPSTLLHVSRATAGAEEARFQNSNTGTAGAMLLSVRNSSSSLILYKNSTGFTPASFRRADGSTIFDDSNVGIDIATNGASADIRLYTGGNTTDRWRIDNAGRIASGGSVDTASMISIDNAQTQGVLSGTSQFGLSSFIRGTSAATSGIAGITSAPASAAVAFTTANMDGFLSRTFTKGAGSTITNAVAFRGVIPTVGTNNAFLSDNGGFSGQYFIFGNSSNISRLTGNLGIGGDPTYQVDVQATTQPVLAIRYTSNTGTNSADLRFLSTNGSFLGDWSGIRATQGGGVDTHDLEFFTSNAGAATERMRIEYAGRVNVGEVLPLAANIVSNSGLNSWFSVIGNSANAYPMILAQVGNNASGGTMAFYKTRTTTGAHTTTVNSGDNVGVLLFLGANTAAYQPAGRISCAVDGTPSTTSMPGRLVFETTTQGTNVLTERMRINTLGFTSLGGIDALRLLHIKATAGSAFFRIDGSSGDNSAVIELWGSSTVTSNWRIANNATISGAFEIARQLTSTPTFASPAFSIGSTDNVGIGESPAAGHALIVAGPNLTGTSQHGVRSDLTANTNATAQVNAFYASPATSATTGTLANIFGYHAANGGSAGRTITTQFGFYADQLSVGGTNNYAFFSNQTTSQTGAYHFYGNGDAPTYLGGVVHLGNLNPSSATGLYVDAKTNGLGAVFNSTHASGLALKFNNSGATFGYIGSGTQIASGGFYSPAIGDFGINCSGSGKLLLCANDSVKAIVTASGDLLVGASVMTAVTDNSNPAPTSAVGIISQATALNIKRAGSNGNVIEFFRGGVSGNVGSISITTTTTAYTTSSDQRLKTNIVDAPSALGSLASIQVRSFDWLADGSHQEFGVIAQELVQIAPEAVIAPESEGKMYTVDYSKLVPRLVKATQELKSELDSEKSKNQDLESKLAAIEARLAAAGL